MRPLKYYTVQDWLKLKPLGEAFRQWRNDLVLKIYLLRKGSGQVDFLRKASSLQGKNIALIVAFEQPWALQWLLQNSAKYLENSVVLVFDNSRDMTKRLELHKICEQQQAAYLSLPFNATQHANRSHGMAMTWIYHNIVRAIQPENFVFIDHDLIPMKPLNWSQYLKQQDCYGRLNTCTWGWSLWAGYCMFRYSAIEGIHLNFLYDFSIGLDTGGRNWKSYYRHLNRPSMSFTDEQDIDVSPGDGQHYRKVQVIDEAWLHIGSISYNDNFSGKKLFFELLAEAAEQGMSWEQMKQAGQSINKH
ncbi:MAG: glycosyltransferase family 2 protein [Pseudomonadales bacterium]|nr:glycosyltransferase family 2 protein [Pseudomonadales bacterium]